MYLMTNAQRLMKPERDADIAKISHNFGELGQLYASINKLNYEVDNGEFAIAIIVRVLANIEKLQQENNILISKLKKKRCSV